MEIELKKLEPYSNTAQTITGSASPLWIVQMGALPAGIVMATSGRLSGTPTTAGPYVALLGGVIGPNLVNPADLTRGQLLRINGETQPDLNYMTSGYIPAKAGQKISFSVARRAAFYDTGYVFVNIFHDTLAAGTFTPPSDGFVRICPYAAAEPTFQVENGATQTEYQPFSVADYLTSFRVTDPLTPAAVAALLNRPGDPETIALATATLPIITGLARAYVRDRGFDGNTPRADVAAVIITATARMMSNPDQNPTTINGISIGIGYQGWTLAELSVLNRYRKRSA